MLQRKLRRMLCLLLLVGCADPPIGEVADGSRRGPSLRPIDSVTLSETPEVFVSRVNDIELGQDGSVFVSDVALAQVLQFSSDGHLLRTFGAKGDGPGEFRSPGWLSLIGDSLLAVRDVSHRRIEVFRARTGVWIGRVPMPLPNSTGLAYAGSDLLVAGLDIEQRSSFQRIEVGPAMNDTSSIVRGTGFGAIPADVHGSPLLADAFRLSNLAERSGRVAQFFEVSNWMLLAELASGRTDSIRWPVSRRKGAPVGLLPRVLKDQSLGMRALQHVSQPIEVAWRDDDIVTVVSVDPDRTVRRYKGSTFVSLVDVARHRACVDTRLPVSEDPPPAVSVRGDTMVVLHQTSNVGGAPATRVSRCLIELDGCDWIPGR